MSTYTRPVMLLLSGLLLLTLAIAVLNTLVPLWLAQEHMSTWQVGVVSSSYFTGNLVGTLLTGYVIKRITVAIIWPPSFLPLAVPALA